MLCDFLPVDALGISIVFFVFGRSLRCPKSRVESRRGEEKWSIKIDRARRKFAHLAWSWAHVIGISYTLLVVTWSRIAVERGAIVQAKISGCTVLQHVSITRPVGRETSSTCTGAQKCGLVSR